MADIDIVAWLFGSAAVLFLWCALGVVFISKMSLLGPQTFWEKLILGPLIWAMLLFQKKHK